MRKIIAYSNKKVTVMGKYALIIVSALVFSILTYSSGLRSAMFSSTLRIVETFSGNQANSIAQSTMMVVMNDIKEKGSNSVFVPVSGGTYQSSVTQWSDVRGSYQVETVSSGDTLRIISTGLYEDRSSSSTAGFLATVPPWNPQFDTAVHTEGNITLNGSANIKGHVSTNSTAQDAVYLSSTAFIDSSLYVGPGADPGYVIDKQDEFATNVGLETEALAEEQDYPMPAFPAYPSKDLVGASVNLGGGSPRTLAFSEYDGYYIPEVTVKGGNDLTVEVNGESVLYTSRFEVNQGHLHITGTGTLTIIAEDVFDIGGNSSVNGGGETSRVFTLYGGDSNLSFSGTTLYNAGLFLKSADITITGSNTFQGSLISGGNNVSLSGNAEVNARVIYAPNAHVSMSGASFIKGAVISDSFSASNNSIVDFTDIPDDELPDLQSAADPVYTLLYWN
tara:strand:- start:56068 stop:57411 length:1344 start_codon:yes stop_codon:yes gene_type:complete